MKFPRFNQSAGQLHTLMYDRIRGFNMVDDPASISGYLVEGSRDIDLTRQLGAIAKRRGIEAQIESSTDTEQTVYYSAAKAITPTFTMGQTFTTSTETTTLCGISVYLKDKSDEEKVILTVWDSPSKTVQLAQSEVTRIAGTEAAGFYQAYFIPIIVEPETTYYFELTHGGGGDNLVWLGGGTDLYAGGTAYRNGLSVDDEDLYFVTYKKLNLGFGGIKGIHTYRRSGGDIPLFGHGTDCYKLSGQEYTLEKTTTEDFNEGVHNNTVGANNEITLDPNLAETMTKKYYEEGEQHVSWQQGYVLRTPTVEIRGTHIYLDVIDNDTSEEASIVTTTKVDLTLIDTLKIDWRNTGTDYYNDSYLIVSSIKEDSYLVFDKRLGREDSFEREIASLDVSDLTGEYYIRVHAKNNINGGGHSELFIYNIYGTTDNGYNVQGTWTSPVYTIPSTPISSRLDWEADIPDNADPEATINLVFRVRGSHDGQIWGDWQTVTASGGGIPLTKHYQVQINFTALKAFGSPSVQSFTMTYTTTTDTAISIKTDLSGDRLRFIDYEDVCYFADGGRPQRYDGITVLGVGVDPPGTAPTIADSDMAGSPNGKYTAKVTFVNEYGAESNGSDASESLTVSGKQISWSNIPTGPTGTKSRNLYRTKAAGDIYYFVAAIDDNTTTTYTDDTSDANLITELETDNNIPPDSTIIYEHLNYMLYVSADNPERLYYSKPGKSDSVPPNNYKEFPGPIKAVRVYQNALIVGGDKFTSAIFGDIWDSDPAVDNTAVKTISEAYGPLSHEAMVQCFSNQGDILVFPTRQGLNYLTPGLQENSMRSVPLSRQVQPIFDGAVNPENMAAVYDKNRYIIALNYFGTDTPIQTNNIILVLDFRTGEWSPPWYIPSSGFVASNGNVYFGSPTIGQIYKLDAGTSDDGENIHAIAKLNVDYTPLGPHKKKRFAKCRIAVTPDSDTTSLQFNPSVDGIQAMMEPGAMNTWGGVYVSPKMRIQLQRGYEYQVTIEDDSTKDWVIPKIIIEYERGE